tara:strand:+ start:257 stop:1363 length:1107 start_codon:yes stop_codon:yes gene_type:complete
MRVGILGTRGIPNHYGGFEQFAEYLSIGLVNRGHEVFVYNSHLHPFQEKVYNGVNLIHCFDAEDKIGTAGQFIYDLNCILDSRKRKFDVLLQLGYTSSSIWGFLLPNQTPVLTNMDGLEWKRTKFSKKVQAFLKQAEKWAVKRSDSLIADSIGIQQYLKEKYKVDSHFIPYGAEVIDSPKEETLVEYNQNKFDYHMLIARIEPENNIETILDGFTKSNSQKNFLVVGKLNTPLAKQLLEKYKLDKRIQFLGGIYDKDKLDHLRFYSDLYFHGHSVGGTNPSLLEAMASSAYLVAHQNVFNQSILENEAQYFSNSEEVKKIIESEVSTQERERCIASNLTKIRTIYSWETIISSYESRLLNLVQEKQST